MVLALQAPRGEQEARSATLPLKAPPTWATAQAERPRAYRETSRVASAQRTEPSDRCRRTQGAREEQASAGQAVPVPEALLLERRRTPARTILRPARTPDGPTTALARPRTTVAAPPLSVR